MRTKQNAQVQGHITPTTNYRKFKSFVPITAIGDTLKSKNKVLKALDGSDMSVCG